ncbi:MAG: apolipoprotein N-acyltransferase [Acidobacteriia bacterium]|nr:apolipoprotein N-acyltransferase [Terriglobia bacterium]
MFASALSGLLLFACFPLLGWHLLVWFACAPLFVVLAPESRRRRAFLLGYVAGAVYLAGTCYWFVAVMERHGGVSPLLSYGVLALFVVVFALFFGGFGFVLAWAAGGSVRRAILLIPFLWVAMEIARTYLITGFPWNLLGYAVQANGLRQVAAVTAVYGLSFLAATTSALLAWIWLEPRSVKPRLALVGWCALLLAANILLAPRPLPQAKRTALLVQPNIALNIAVVEQWAPWRDPTRLNDLVDLSVRNVREAGTLATTPLIVWPENPAPFYFERDPIFRSAVERMAHEARAYVVVGSVNYADAEATQPKNSAMVLDPEGRVLLAYDKIHLVPFGEYVPAWAFPSLVGKITYEAGNFVPGTSYQTASMRDGGLGVLICYEAIFPQLVRRLVPEGPGVLVNISDDGWFGNSAAPFQHLEMARLRAIENRRYLLRATNDGITVVIEPYGRIIARLPRHEFAVLKAQFDFLSQRTFYTRHGDVFAWLSVVVAAALVGSGAARKRKSRG